MENNETPLATPASQGKPRDLDTLPTGDDLIKLANSRRVSAATPAISAMPEPAPEPPALTQDVALLKVRANPDLLMQARKYKVDTFFVQAVAHFLSVDGYASTDKPIGAPKGEGFWFSFNGQTNAVTPIAAPAQIGGALMSQRYPSLI
jgi:hypothetical protein